MPTPSSCGASGFPFPGLPADASLSIASFSDGGTGKGSLRWRNPGDSAPSAQPFFSRVFLSAAGSFNGSISAMPTLELRVSAGSVPVLEFLSENAITSGVSLPSGGISVVSASLDAGSGTSTLGIALSGVGVVPSDSTARPTTPPSGNVLIQVVALRTLSSSAEFNLASACGIRGALRSAVAMRNASLEVAIMSAAVLASGETVIMLNGLLACTSYTIAASVSCAAAAYGGCLTSVVGDTQSLAYVPLRSYITPCSTPPSRSGKNVHFAVILGGVICLVVLFAFVVFILWWCRCRKAVKVGNQSWRVFDDSPENSVNGSDSNTGKYIALSAYALE
jgi:hypothetical protein